MRKRFSKKKLRAKYLYRSFKFMCIVSLVFLGDLALCSSIYNDSINLKTGLMTYGITEDFSPQITENSSNLSLEYNRYYSHVSTVYVGSRFASDSESGRLNYLSAFTGLKIYFADVGSPIDVMIEKTSINLDPMFKSYINVGISLGKILIQSSGVSNSLEVSGEYVGFEGGSGVQFSITKKVNLDFHVNVEYSSGFGPIDFTSLNTMIFFGSNIFF